MFRLEVKLLVLFVVGCCNGDIVSITYNDSKYEIHDGVIAESWVAKANFTNMVFEEGLAYLELETNPDYDDKVQAYAAGLAEGSLTYQMIFNHYKNIVEEYCNDKPDGYCDNLNTYLEENRKWMDEAIPKEEAENPVLYNAGLILEQLEGISDGYNRSGHYPIPENAIMMLNLFGDLGDLEMALDPSIHNMTTEDLIESGYFPSDGHCSALIKILPNNEDLYVSHVTWNYFNTMLRILKKYNTPFRQTGNSGADDVIPGHLVSFPAYPGTLSSIDDFYILTSGLVSMETTIGNFNPELWKFVQPQEQIHEWMRTIIANRLATDGKTWCDTFSEYNSGTYNNEWMIVDYNLFTPGGSIKPNTLWVLDQIPGHVRAEDQSDLLLLQTYFPSYNSPFYEDIFNMSGQYAFVEKYGDWFTYDKTPRALIFQRDHIKVKDMDSMFKIMRYNDFKNDPLSKCNCDPPYSGENGISSRCDLNPINGTYEFPELSHRLHGGTDAKVTSSEMVKSLQFWAIVGPTYDQQPVFRWSEQEEVEEIPHFGLPDSYDFQWGNHEWVW